MKTLLVVAGEASGDRAAAAVIDRLPGVQAFGLGGPALERRGVELAWDLRSSTALGVGEVGVRAGSVVMAWQAVLRAQRKRRADAALLVNYSEFNARLAPRLHAAGARVVWYGAPQIWAWREGRADVLRRHVDRMAVVLPFEEQVWRRAGVDARYVGHPATETAQADRAAARRLLGMTPYAAAVAVLPGSRPHEVHRLLLPFLDAYERVRSDRASVDARTLLAGGLDDRTREWARAVCAERRVGTVEVDPTVGAIGLLRAFDASLCASGTVSLEAVLARAVPVVAYRVGLPTELVARLLVKVRDVALPNILLGRRAFPELLQRDVRAARLAAALEDVLDRRAELALACNEVETVLGSGRKPSLEVARMLAPWLGVEAQAA
ncbi:MAG TPA: hypothetical protein VKU41_12645 [Polyangiaceae bacterium]|nr:hypothetical protein [Polyangiaceae bacterium]